MKRAISSSSTGIASSTLPTLPQGRWTLFLRVHSAQNLVATGRGSYCKLYLGNTAVTSESAQVGASLSTFLAADSTPQIHYCPPHRVFRTKVVYTDQSSCPEWNEKLELNVLNPNTEILTIRVKNQLLLFCPVLGMCAIPLCNVQVEELVEQWFLLYKQDRPAGHIRLQLLLKENKMAQNRLYVEVKESFEQTSSQQQCPKAQECDLSVQSEKLRRRVQSEEHDRSRVKIEIQMQNFREIQKQEQAKKPAFMQEQIKFEQDDSTQKPGGKQAWMKEMDDMNSEFSSSSYYFADDAASLSRSSDSSRQKQSSTTSEGARWCDEEFELTNVRPKEVVHDALPSSDSSLDEEVVKQRRRRKKEKKRKQYSKKVEYVPSTKADSFPTSNSFIADLRPYAPIKRLSSSSIADSSSSSETFSEEERRRRRKARKAKKKERRRKRMAQRRAHRGFDINPSSSHSLSSSFSSFSSVSSSSDERRKQKTKKHKRRKERAQSQRQRKASSISHSAGPSHLLSNESHLSSSPSSPSNKRPTAYSKSPSGASGYIKALPPQPQQKRSMVEKISAAADMASILSDMTSVAANLQQLAGIGDVGGEPGSLFAIPVPEVSLFLEGQDFSELAL